MVIAPRVLHISLSDYRGGADIAAHRIYQSVTQSGVEARMAVRYSGGTHKDVTEVPFPRFSHWASRWSRGFAERVQKSSNPFHRSLNLFPTGGMSLPDFVPNLVHLHWIGSNTLSLQEIQDIPVPVVWTLHDSWPFSGAEHHPSYPTDERFVSGYTRANRVHSSRVDIDGWVWRRKAEQWRRNFTLAAPSTWMAGQARRSRLMGGQRIVTIPNPIDTVEFAPRDVLQPRDTFRIPETAFVIVTSGVGGTAIDNKGWRLLREALTGVVQAGVRPYLLMIGQSEIPGDLPSGVNGIATGHLTDADEIANAISCANVFVTTSNIESFGLAAAEASSCAIPVIAPAATGLLDVVANQESGWFYAPDNVEQLTAAIVEACEHPDEARARGAAGRARAEKLWSSEVVGISYRNLYEEVLADPLATG